MRSWMVMPVGMGLIAVSLSVLLVGSQAFGGDDTGLFGRLFRGGGTGTTRAAEPVRTPPPVSPTFDVGASPSLLPPGAGGTPGSSLDPATTTPPGNIFDPARVGTAAATPAPRIRPQPRQATAATEADPLVTRIALGRSDDGKKFGMFLQVFTDGTVIDGEGVHHVSPDILRPIAQAVQASELFRLKGHCGSPPTDYIEQIYMTVYQSRLGGIRSNSFSISGNPVGCDLAVRQLHVALENLVAKLSGVAIPTSNEAESVPAGIASSVLHETTPMIGSPPSPSPSISTPGAIPLTLSPAPPTP